jgi:DNA-directed RNA polymerase subunit beta'
MKKDVTVREEVDAKSKQKRLVVIEHKGNLHPQLVIKSEDGSPIAFHPIPEKAYVEVKRGEKVVPGTILAKTPRDMGGTHDITGGLPRVQEIFEARRPKDPAVMSQIDGTVEIQEEKKRNKRVINVRSPKTQEVVQHLVPQGKILNVRSGDFVREGQRLCEGPLVPQEILEISGRDALQRYLLNEVQGVYRSQGVNINDKHVEIILAQMLRKVQVEDPGGTELLPGLVVDRFVLQRENRRAQKAKRKPASFKPVLLGITKASLQSESFISSASFQETTKVLTEAALAGKTDYLLGLKENVIIGNKVPDGTGFKPYRDGEVKKKLEILEQTEAPPVESSPAAQ